MSDRDYWAPQSAELVAERDHYRKALEEIANRDSGGSADKRTALFALYGQNDESRPKGRLSHDG